MPSKHDVLHSSFPAHLSKPCNTLLTTSTLNHPSAQSHGDSRTGGRRPPQLSPHIRQDRYREKSRYGNSAGIARRIVCRVAADAATSGGWWALTSTKRAGRVGGSPREHPAPRSSGAVPRSPCLGGRPRTLVNAVRGLAFLKSRASDGSHSAATYANGGALHAEADRRT